MDSKEKLKCILCKECFEGKEALQNHFRKHGDPMFNVASTENAEVSCDVCDAKFISISKAITHKHKVHPDHAAKYFCSWCGKLFTMKHLHNKHLEKNHSSEEAPTENYHCDSCDVIFYLPVAMLYHNKFFHRQDTELAAIGYSKKMKMYGNELLPIYCCPFCGEEFNNKVNLHKHMGDDHSDENQSPDEVLRCPVCEAIFYHLDAYELHLNLHSTDDLYSETNEINSSKISEFSLETIPPIMEVVENIEPQKGLENMNKMGIEQFLQMAMDESGDNDSSNSKPMDEKVKSKKHKKHKKSKKAAITLDEFLNMNTDVFGEGLDFQGVEEVPTQVVNKRLKIKKLQMPIASSNLEKLKKQGIVIKTKASSIPNKMKASNSIAVGKPIKVANNILAASRQPVVQAEKQSTISTSNEMLTKLLNQSNNQLRIVKKFTKKTDQVSEEDIDTQNGIKKDLVQKEKTDEWETKVECDSQQDETTDPSQNITKAKSPHFTESYPSNIKLPETKKETPSTDNKGRGSVDAEDLINNSDQNQMLTKTPIMSPDINQDFDTEMFDSKKNHVELNTQTSYFEDEAGNEQIEHEKDKISTPKPNSLDALKHLSNVITIKMSQKHIPMENIKLEKEGNEEKKHVNKNEIKDTVLTSPLQKTDISMRKIELSNSLGTLKKLNKQITIQTTSAQPIKKEKSEEYSDGELDEGKIDEDVLHPNDDFNEVNVSHSDYQFQIPKQPISAKEMRLKNKQLQMTKTPGLQGPSKIPNKLISCEQLENEYKEDEMLDNNKNNSELHTNTSYFEDETGNEEIEHEIDKISTPKPVSVDALKHLSNVITIKVSQKHIPMENAKLENEASEEEKQVNKNEIKDAVLTTPLQKTDTSMRKIELSNSLDTLKKLSKQITIQSTSAQPIKKEKLEEYSDGEFDEGEMDEDELHSDDDFNEVNISHNDYKFQIPKQPISAEEMRLKNKNLQMTKTPGLQGPPKIPNKLISCEQPESEYKDKVMKNQTSSSALVKHLKDVTAKPVHSKLNTQVTNNVAKIQTMKRPITKEIHNHIEIFNIEDSDSDEKDNITNPNKKRSSVNTPLETLKTIGNNQITIKTTKTQSTQKTQQMNTNIADISHQNESLDDYNSDNEEKFHMTSDSNETKVSVQTFKTNTVIQEITTTVTKTIRTVNESMEMNKNSSSQNIQMVRNPQMKHNIHQARNYQGVKVKYAPQNVQPKMRNATPVVRPSATSNIVTSNQLLPVRHSFPIRPANSRMPITKKIMPSPSIQNKPITRPVKVALNVSTSPVKRPTENTGPFSCFKKPKESLIPETDFGEQFASTSHISRSNFTSTTKVMKGSSTITSTQMKSEMSAHSQQQLSKLSGVSGLKITKSCQKQATHAEEMSEVNTSKRIALDAIEKLQKQGLLVKKPRIEEYDDAELSNVESDGYDDEFE